MSRCGIGRCGERCRLVAVSCEMDSKQQRIVHDVVILQKSRVTLNLLHKYLSVPISQLQRTIQIAVFHHNIFIFVSDFERMSINGASLQVISFVNFASVCEKDGLHDDEINTHVVEFDAVKANKFAEQCVRIIEHVGNVVREK